MRAVLFDRAMQTPLPNVKLICSLSSNQTDYGKLVMLDCGTVYGTISWVSPLCPVSHASSLFIQSRENRASERSSQGGSHCLWNNNLNKRFKAHAPFIVFVPRKSRIPLQRDHPKVVFELTNFYNFQRSDDSKCGWFADTTLGLNFF